MDPDAALEELRRALDDADTADAAGDRNTATDRYRHAAELIRALDEWLCRGGFPPADWQRALPPRHT
jgi:hypothetical protein